MRGCNTIAAYEKINQIGHGVYGEVYAGKERSTGKLVAIKKMRLEKETEGFPITAIREIKILKAVDHPNVIKLLDIVTSRLDKRKVSVYMVFEHMTHDLR